MRFTWKKPQSWDPLLRKAQKRRLAATTILDSFLEIYSDVTVFHAARPRNVQSYYNTGLHLANHQELDEEARRIFLSGEFPEIDEIAFNKAIKGPSKIDNHRSYVSLDDRACEGGYLVYGSERVSKIAAALSRNGIRDYRQVLKRFGRSTIFTISLPISMCSESDLRELSDQLCAHIAAVKNGSIPPKIDFSFLLSNALPACCILSHEAQSEQGVS